MGATPLWGGAREPMEVTSGRPSEARDLPLVSSIGEGGAGGRSAREAEGGRAKAMRPSASIARPIREHGHNYCAP